MKKDPSTQFHNLLNFSIEILYDHFGVWYK